MRACGQAGGRRSQWRSGVGASEADRRQSAAAFHRMDRSAMRAALRAQPQGNGGGHGSGGRVGTLFLLVWQSGELDSLGETIAEQLNVLLELRRIDQRLRTQQAGIERISGEVRRQCEEQPNACGRVVSTGIQRRMNTHGQRGPIPRRVVRCMPVVMSYGYVA